MTETEKTCTRCKVLKPHSEFHKSKNNKDGKASWCKACKKAKDQEGERRIRYRPRLKGDRLKAMRERMAVKLADPEYRRHHNDRQRVNSKLRRHVDPEFVERAKRQRVERKVRMTHLLSELELITKEVGELRKVCVNAVIDKPLMLLADKLRQHQEEHAIATLPIPVKKPWWKW